MSPRRRQPLPVEPTPLPSALCRFPACASGDIRASGLCTPHYERWRRAGRPVGLDELAPDRQDRGELVRLVCYVPPAMLAELEQRAGASHVSVSHAATLLLGSAILATK